MLSYSSLLFLLIAISAVGTTVAGHSAAACFTMFSEERGVGFHLEESRFGVREFEVNILSFVAQSRLECLE